MRDHYKKQPIRPVKKRGVRWFNRPVEFDDFKDVREYVDSILGNHVGELRFKPTSFITDASLLIRLIENVANKTPTIINPVNPNEYRPFTNPLEVELQKLSGEIEDKRWVNSHRETWMGITKKIDLLYKKLEREYNSAYEKYEEKKELIFFRNKVLKSLISDVKKASLNGIIFNSENWEFLPKDRDYIKPLTQYYSELSKRKKAQYDMERLKKINSLKPIEVKKGLNSFEGYCVFIFKSYQEVIFECPIVGNATYIATGDWEKLSKLRCGTNSCKITQYRLTAESNDLK